MIFGLVFVSRDFEVSTVRPLRRVSTELDWLWAPWPDFSDKNSYL